MTRNLPASIQARLLLVARERGEEFQRTLTTYAVERFLYRLSCLPTRDTLWLKGARLFDLWFDSPQRATADVDFLGFGASDIPAVREAIAAICRQEADDGVSFDPDTLTVEPIREEARYGGLRARLVGRLGAMRCPIQLDIGFGDAVTPGPEEAAYPTLLHDLPAPRLKVYPKATVMAEKLEAVIHLGMANSRMKDFFDLRVLVRDGDVNDAELARAIRATFERRGTRIPDNVPIGLADEFSQDPQKLAQWAAFLRRNRLPMIPLDEVIVEIREALLGPLREATN